MVLDPENFPYNELDCAMFTARTALLAELLILLLFRFCCRRSQRSVLRC